MGGGRKKCAADFVHERPRPNLLRSPKPERVRARSPVFRTAPVLGFLPDLWSDALWKNTSRTAMKMLLPLLGIPQRSSNGEKRL